ncbi:MAG TPA: cytochrome c oxidase subunit II [Gemmatimonadaceae bacterium]|nr:cytochrome c oxidase subunit II [Gemmatimonadaceae bacterium]
MPLPSRGRRWAAATIVASALLLLAACSNGPNTTFEPHSEFGRAIDDLWNLLLRLGTAVFILVEALLVYTIIKFRHREGRADPAHTHGDTRLEILWTITPAIILAFIAVPTIRTIFQTQAKASADALQVEVYGHQWWWEFRYPQYGVVTADEVYLPIGRKVNFSLRTVDVLHSFWIPQMGGKRDVIANHVNYLWFTPDSNLTASDWVGSCNEYCGTSHANMKFRAFTVPAADFERWAKHQAQPSTFGVAPAAAPAPLVHPAAQVTGPAPAPADADEGYVFPVEKMRENTVPHTPLPYDLAFDHSVTGDPMRGFQTYSKAACIGCHTIKGNPSSVGIIGPNLTHIASRHTIAAGLYPNDAEHLKAWIKDARGLKPGVVMPDFGIGEVDPVTHARITAPTGGLTDQQVADIAAYLQQLK